MTARKQERITVLLVDDHAVVREGYRRLLERRGHIAVAGEAENASEAERQFLALQPQVVVMDLALGGGVSGIEATRLMLGHRPDARVLIFSMHEQFVYAEHALRAGALGYVTKSSAPKVLVEAVDAVARGRSYLSPDIAQAGVRHNLVNDEGDSPVLSARELEILRLLVSGMPLADIARLMELSPKTVANHQSSIKQKLGATNPVQLAQRGFDFLRRYGSAE